MEAGSGRGRVLLKSPLAGREAACRSVDVFLLGLAWPSSWPTPLQAARANLEKAQSELSGAADEAARAEIQIRIEANEALVKALE